jgi:hypothetical protein
MGEWGAASYLRHYRRLKRSQFDSPEVIRARGAVEAMHLLFMRMAAFRSTASCREAGLHPR